jgi:hypothetical protein
MPSFTDKAIMSGLFTILFNTHGLTKDPPHATAPAQ